MSRSKKRKFAMHRSMAVAALAAIVLGGCDSGGSDTEARQMKASSEYIDKLKALSEFNRGLALRRAVQDSQQRCKRVVSSGYQEDYKNMSLWTVRCTDGEYALFIAPSGDVQVRPCEHLQKLGLPTCRIPEAKPE